MITYSLSDFVGSLSTKDFELLHKRWVLYASRLIAKHGCQTRIEPTEVVGETFYLVESSARGYACPEGMDIGEFFVSKLRTTVERLAKQVKRDAKRSTEFNDNLIPWQQEGESFSEYADELTEKLRCSLADGRSSEGLIKYVTMMPHIIQGGFDQNYAAELLGKTTGNLANYRHRIESRFFPTSALKKHGK
ncbi:hypothetical protein G3A56_28135 (plasmid) [Rhizobium oryzihabitans]|jgi:hypothetical protein|uniref:Uncharacterized protein n=1 Tax=Rhizobium oryzihabitans TaxID=2267833 RepID=A0A7L5BS73_9HYPH|nr:MULTISPECIES: hypothetical protein [Rhizobium/Agrobacterium group]QIB41643.1 hypothetical protein G3A56_28135 [Rhizobium oryzihabitans]TQN58700.1 hypothetical protein FLX27_25865 [Agrobacterium tumefaciens]